MLGKRGFFLEKDFDMRHQSLIECYDAPEPAAERELITHVIIRAIRDVLNPIQDQEHEHNRYTASAWLRLDRNLDFTDIESPFTFLWCCYWLEIDPKAIRNQIVWMRERGVRLES